MISRRGIVAAFIALTATAGLAACGSAAESPAPEASSSAATATATPTPTPTIEAEPVPLTAAEIGAALAEANANITEVVAITEDNDPNTLIGRPNGYSDAAVLYDARVTCDGLGVDCGMTLEVWPTAEGADQRAAYIQELQSDSPLLGSEYHTVRENYLLRVSGDIVPSEAAVIAEQFNAVELSRVP